MLIDGLSIMKDPLINGRVVDTASMGAGSRGLGEIIGNFRIKRWRMDRRLLLILTSKMILVFQYDCGLCNLFYHCVITILENNLH